MSVGGTCLGRRALRLTRGVTWALAVAGAVTLSACTDTVTGHGAPDPLAQAASTSSATPSATSSATPTPKPTPTHVPTTPVLFGKLSFAAPTTWKVTKTGTSACLTRLGDTTAPCTLQIIDVAAVRAAKQTIRTPDPKAPQGWWLGAGSPLCATKQRIAVTASQSMGSSFVKMRNKTAAYGKWLVHCADAKQNFSPRLWWLPVTQAAFVEYHSDGGAVDALVDQVIASVSVGG